MQAYRAAVASADSPEERQALVDGGLSVARDHFGLDVPRDVTVRGKDFAAAYEEGFADHEADLLRAARVAGWDTKLTGELRDHGVRLALDIADRGTPMTPDEEATFRQRFEGRLAKAEQELLLIWFRKNRSARGEPAVLRDHRQPPAMERDHPRCPSAPA